MSENFGDQLKKAALETRCADAGVFRSEGHAVDPKTASQIDVGQFYVQCTKCRHFVLISLGISGSFDDYNLAAEDDLF